MSTAWQPSSNIKERYVVFFEGGGGSSGKEETMDFQLFWYPKIHNHEILSCLLAQTLWVFLLANDWFVEN